MKKLFYLCIALVGMSAAAQVGIGVLTADINASAQLEVSSTSKGFLAPRMTQAQKNNISSPAAGLLVYQTDAPSGFYYFDGSVWQSGLGPQGLQGVTGPQGAQGVVGATGPMGPQGLQGIAGAIGAQGLQGVAGNDGLDGATGPMGPMGPQGPQGEMGPAGSNASITMDAISNSSSANGATIASGVLTLAPADANNGGVVTTGSQTFAGSKTFSSNVAIKNINVGTGTGNTTNTAVGFNALTSTTTGGYNTALGNTTLTANTTGGSNIAIGAQTLYNNTTGSNNSALGVNSLNSNTTGGANTAIGRTSLYSNTTGAENASVGHYSLAYNTNGNKNTSIGVSTLGTNATGSNNTALGHSADVSTDGLTNATAIGYQAIVDASNKIQLGNANVTSVNTSATVTGAGFKTPSGTSAQYLMADGSSSEIDLSGYATTAALNAKAPIASPVFTGSITTPGVIFDAGNWQMGPYGSNFTLYKGGCCNFITVDGAGRMGIGGNYSPSYQLDVQGEGRFTSALRATSFIKTGGTSSQYLMADGSSSEIDLSGYATTTALNNEVARAETAEATLAPKASPSFTGVVTVGGASSTASAVVEVSSTTQGFLPPRMTETQRNAISNPVAGLLLWCTNCGTSGEIQVYNGSAWTNMMGGAASESIIPTVTSATGRIWMDRNLGASRVALSSTDAEAYGDYYQWGRPADGHQAQHRTNNNSSGVTYTKSSSSVPSTNLFIQPTDGSNDWLNTPDNNLWVGSNPANNPCPAGFRIPTVEEWAAEQATWSNAAGAFASPLKLTQAGMLISFGDGGAIFTAKDVFGQYHSQTAFSNGGVQYMGIEPNNTWFDTNYFKSMGMSCRCIKE